MLLVWCCVKVLLWLSEAEWQSRNAKPRPRQDGDMITYGLSAWYEPLLMMLLMDVMEFEMVEDVGGRVRGWSKLMYEKES